MRFKENLDKILASRDELAAKLASGASGDDYVKFSKKYAEIEPVANKIEQYNHHVLLFLSRFTQLKLPRIYLSLHNLLHLQKSLTFVLLIHFIITCNVLCFASRYRNITFLPSNFLFEHFEIKHGHGWHIQRRSFSSFVT